MQSAVVAINSSDLLAGNSVPLVLAVAGSFLSVKHAVIEYIPGSTAYTDPNVANFKVQVGTAFFGNFSTLAGVGAGTGFPGLGLTGTAGRLTELAVSNSAAANSAATSVGSNVGIFFTPSAAVATGNGTLKITVDYDVIPL